MRAIVLAGFGVAAVAAAVAAWLLVLSDGGGDGEEALPVPTQAVVGASTGVTATATPRPEALRELPPALWTAIEPEDTEEAGDGNMFLLDLETGQMYSPTAEVLTWDMRADAFISWAATGQIEVGMLGFEGAIEGKRASYLGEALGPMRRLPGERNRISIRGVVAYEEDDAYFLYDLTTGSQLGEVTGPDGSLGSWSADGRYLSFGVSPNTSLPLDPVISIWDVETGRVVVEVFGDELVWAESGYRFLYGAIDPSDPEKQVYEQRVHDIDSGTELIIPDLSERSLWSSQRYVLTDATIRDDEGQKYAFSVYDIEEQRNIMTLHGAWPGTWLDEGTLGFTGDVCDTYGFYTIDIGGANLEKVTDSGVAHPSRQGDRIAYSRWDESGSMVTIVVDLGTRQTREYFTGDARLPAYENTEGRFWSPDGRYLALIKPGGKGGPCEFDPPQRLEVEVH